MDRIIQIIERRKKLADLGRGEMLWSEYDEIERIAKALNV